MNCNYPQDENRDSSFIKAMIKIANPTWTIDQIEIEYERKLKEIKESPNDCEICSG